MCVNEGTGLGAEAWNSTFLSRVYMRRRPTRAAATAATAAALLRGSSARETSR